MEGCNDGSYQGLHNYYRKSVDTLVKSNNDADTDNSTSDKNNKLTTKAQTFFSFSHFLRLKRSK